MWRMPSAISAASTVKTRGHSKDGARKEAVLAALVQDMRGC